MVEYVIGSLLLAFILDAIDFEVQFIIGFKEFFGIDISKGTYYLLFLVGGFILALADKVREK